MDSSLIQKAAADGPPSHLNEKALTYLQLSDAERIEKIRSPFWIGHPQAHKLHQQLDDLFYYPKISRMPNALVCGFTNAGKSFAVERWVNDKNADVLDESILPVLMVQAPFEPDLRGFFALCLDALRAPYVFRWDPLLLMRQMGEVLVNSQTKVVVVDEVHHMTVGSPDKQRKFMNALKFISNDLRIPVVAIGTKDAQIAFQADQQIGNRFEPLVVPRWENNAELRRLLATFEQYLPLREPSGLSEKLLASKLHYLSEGLIGEVTTLLRRAAVAAIRSGQEQITPTLLDSLGWVRPGERHTTATNAIK